VIEAPLEIGFVARGEQTGHKAQKPASVYRPLIEMVTKPGDIVLDPMAGSGTTGAVARATGRFAILSDHSEQCTAVMEARLGCARRPLPAVVFRRPAPVESTVPRGAGARRAMTLRSAIEEGSSDE
jgi:hypothetical protein